MIPESLSSTSPTMSGVATGHQDFRQSSPVGVEPIQQIVMMEDHNDAYYAWKKAGLRDRIVVHVDAHIDFGWIPERDPAELLEARSLRELEEQSAKASLWNFSGRSTRELINIGNYLNPALREGIVRSFYWVVPDGFFSTLKQRKLLEQMLNTMRKVHPRSFQNITSAGRSLRAEIYGKPMTVCALSDLPEFEEGILLDIDTDFLVIESISASYPYAELPRTTPWIWPEELVARLRERGLRTDFVTIAYSVEGGYTPLGCKYLGDDLATLFRDPSLVMGHRETMALTRRAALYQEQKKIPEAIRAYERALARHSDGASIHYQLAQLFYEQGQAGRARGHYEQAVALDPSYRTAYNNFGPVCFNLGRFAQAEADYRKALAFDPRDANAYYGLADLCLGQRRWNEAIAHYRKASELRPDEGRGHLGQGYVYMRLRRWNAAEDELKQALKSEKYRGWAQYWLGYVYTKRRHWDDALAANRAARRFGFHDITIHLSLGRLYVRKRNFYKASRHYGWVIRLFPAVLRVVMRRLRERAIRIFSTRRYNAQPG